MHVSGRIAKRFGSGFPVMSRYIFSSPIQFMQIYNFFQCVENNLWNPDRILCVEGARQ